MAEDVTYAVRWRLMRLLMNWVFVIVSQIAHTTFNMLLFDFVSFLQSSCEFLATLEHVRFYYRQRHTSNSRTNQIHCTLIHLYVDSQPNRKWKANIETIHLSRDGFHISISRTNDRKLQVRNMHNQLNSLDYLEIFLAEQLLLWNRIEFLFRLPPFIALIRIACLLLLLISFMLFNQPWHAADSARILNANVFYQFSEWNRVRFILFDSRCSERIQPDGAAA